MAGSLVIGQLKSKMQARFKLEESHLCGSAEWYVFTKQSHGTVHRLTTTAELSRASVGGVLVLSARQQGMAYSYTRTTCSCYPTNIHYGIFGPELPGTQGRTSQKIMPRHARLRSASDDENEHIATASDAPSVKIALTAVGDGDCEVSLRLVALCAIVVV